MCRNIKLLLHFEPPATRDEIEASALQYVRKLSGMNKPSRMNQAAFDLAVKKVTQATIELFDHLEVSGPPRSREAERLKAIERGVETGRANAQAPTARRERSGRGAPMNWFVISLTYVQPLAAIDAAMKAHVAFLERHERAGRFIVWGRKVPRTGGIIIACAAERAEIERAMEEDPFVTKKLATYEVTEFAPKPQAIVDGVAALLR